MYLTVGVFVLIALVLLSPVIWLAWWMLVELGSRANGSYADKHETSERSYPRAA